MTKSEVCECIRKTGVIPAVRVQSVDDAHFAADCVIDAGIPIVEITMTVPGAVQLILHLASRHPGLVVGAGTVMDTETARKCVDAGAKFLTAPSFDASLVEFAAQQEIAVIPGALTPTEVVSAWRAGGDFVKVFPCAPVGGEKYIKALKTALPQVPLIAAGGVNQQTATSFILSGADGIGIGRELIPRQSIEMREGERIRELARRFLKFVQDARQRLVPARESAGYSMH